MRPRQKIWHRSRRKVGVLPDDQRTRAASLHASLPDALLTCTTGKKVSDADLKRAEQKALFNRNLYLLELAAGNGQYLKYRNEQFPEIVDVCPAFCCRVVAHPRRPSASRTWTFYPRCTRTSRCIWATWVRCCSKYVCCSFVLCAECRVQEEKKLSKLATLMDPEFERRAFMHECRYEFPGAATSLMDARV